MNTTSITLQRDGLWDELQDIFLKFKKFDKKTQVRIKKLGFRTHWEKCKHPKMYIELDRTYIITLCTTPSDNYAGRQILRQIRKVYEEYDAQKH